MAGGGAVMDTVDIDEAIAWQASHAEKGGAPGTARVIRGLGAAMKTDTATARRMAGWQGLSLKDAMPLRIHGGLHHLLLTGEDTRLEPVYAGLTTDQGAVDALVAELVETYDHRLLAWFDGPPQTNEAGRSASIVAGLLWLAGRVQPRFELNEIGSSAGINTMLDRYRFDLGGVTVGPAGSPIEIAPEWRGDPPPDNPFAITQVRGCDIAPIDLADEDAALRLKSYVWPDMTERMARIDAAIALACEEAPDVAKQAADAFVADMLAREHPAGLTRVLFHSIVWQYIPDEGQASIVAAMERAGARASEDRPLAWVQLETNRETFAHELRVRYWPGGGDAVLLAQANPHGAWVEWF